MREIKFRAWDKNNKKMVNVDMILFSTKEIDYKENNNEPISWEHFILMQYTGLKDKNGKEIYEGDIVKDSTSYPLEIYWMGLAWGFRWKDDVGDVAEQIICDEDWDAEYNGSGDKFEYKEIIGNIHENGELLNDRK